jgi:hypothetical protein
MNKYFIGAFLGDVDRYDYDHEILLVYKREIELPYYRFEVELMSHPDYSGISYDYLNKDMIVYVFKIPLDYEDTYDQVCNGLYSQLSPEYKLILTKFWDAEKHKESSKVFNIIFKTDKLKEYWKAKGVDSNDICMESEVWPPVIYENELFWIENF